MVTTFITLGDVFWLAFTFVLLRVVLPFVAQFQEAGQASGAEEPLSFGMESAPETPQAARLLIAEEEASALPTTLFSFLHACSKLSPDVLADLSIIDVDKGQARLKKRLQQDKEWAELRLGMLRAVAQKITHPLFGIRNGVVEPDSGMEKFRATQIVDWLATNLPLGDLKGRARAVDICRAMQQAGMIQPLRRHRTERKETMGGGTKKKVKFGDKMRFWTFVYSQVGEGWSRQRSKLLKGAQQEPTPSPSPPQQSATMSKRDWEYLFSSAKTLKFADGGEIIAQGAKNSQLYRVSRGNVRSETHQPNGVVQLRALLPQHGVFGEETCLGILKLSDTRYVSDGPSVVKAVERRAVESMLRIEPQICRLLWRNGAIMSAKRLISVIRSEPWLLNFAEQYGLVDAEDADGDFDKDDEMRALRRCFPGEAPLPQLIKRFGVRWQGRRRANKASLLITPECVGIYSVRYKKTFRQVLRYEALSVEPISELGQHKLIFLSTSGKNTVVFFDNADDMMAACDLIQHLRPDDAPVASPTSEDAPVGESLTGEDWLLLLQGCKLMAFPAGQAVASGGEILQITKGEVALIVSDLRVCTMQESELIGQLEFLLGQQKAPVQYEALVDSEAYAMDAAHLQSLIVRKPDLAGRFYRHLALELGEKREQLITP